MASSDQSKQPKSLLPPNAKVETFALPNLRDTGRKTYSQIKNNFDSAAQSPGARRFLLSEMVQQHLSVEEEERRRFDARLQEELSSIRAEAHAMAYAEGLKAGNEEGQKLAFNEEKSRIALLLEGLAGLIHTLGVAREKISDQYEKALVDTAFRMARVIVDHEITEKPESIVFSIKAILEKIAKEDDIRIRVGSYDAGTLQKIESEIKKLSHEGRITFETDSGLPAGDCIVESISGEVASFIDQKFLRLSEEIKRTFPEKDLNRKTGS